MAFLPVPFQTVLAALGALWLRVNLPLAVALICITNPLTMAPAFYLCYKVGAWLLGATVVATGKHFQPSIEWLFDQLAVIWQPLVAGSLLTGSAPSALRATAWYRCCGALTSGTNAGLCYAS